MGSKESKESKPSIPTLSARCKRAYPPHRSRGSVGLSSGQPTYIPRYYMRSCIGLARRNWKGEEGKGEKRKGEEAGRVGPRKVAYTEL